MKLRKLFLMPLLIGSVSLANTSRRPLLRQRREQQLRPRNTAIQSNTVEFDLIYDFFAPGETFRIRFIVVLPKTIPGRQKIIGMKYSPKPSRIFDENGNRYAEFVFLKPDRQTKVEISIRAELLRYDLFTARERHIKDRPEDPGLKDFLRQEKHIEKDHPDIQQIAESIEGQTELNIVRNIYDYVIDNMEYSVHGRKDWGAVKALQQKKGDCSEYSDLFVALCRAKNIPARVATGYTVRFDAISSKHNWAEVYLQEYGWIPFDPSSGDVENFIIRDRAFGRMRPAYIYLTYIRNDEVLRDYHFGRYTYWGDRVRLTDKIEFRQSAPPLQKTH